MIWIPDKYRPSSKCGAWSNIFVTSLWQQLNLKYVSFQILMLLFLGMLAKWLAPITDGRADLYQSWVKPVSMYADQLSTTLYLSDDLPFFMRKKGEKSTFSLSLNFNHPPFLPNIPTLTLFPFYITPPLKRQKVIVISFHIFTKLNFFTNNRSF